MKYAIELLIKELSSKKIEKESFKNNTSRVKKVRIEIEDLERALRMLEE